MHSTIKRAHYKASLPSVLEHPELDRGDGSRPDCRRPLPSRLFVVGVCSGITHVLKFLLGYTWMCQQWKLAQLQTTLRSARAVNTLLLQRLSSLSQLQSKRWECMVWPLESSWGPIDLRLVEATYVRTGSLTGSIKNLVIAIQRGNAFSILSAGSMRS